MTDIKEIISTEILNRMQDQSVANVLREILFTEDNEIDWNETERSLIKNIPELKVLLGNELCQF